MSNGKIKRLLGDDELAGIARQFKLLGEPMRLKILQAVCQVPLNVNDIVAATGTTQANVSKHLALRAAGGVLNRKKEGQCVYYGMKNRLVIKLCELVHSQPAA